MTFHWLKIGLLESQYLSITWYESFLAHLHNHLENY